MTCRYCGYHNGGHDENCPEVGGELSVDIELWQEGWNDGRSRSPKASESPVYLLGWLRGEVALEEAENSVSWSG